MTQFLGIAAAFISLFGVVVGLPAQVVKNFRRKSCEGLSLSLILTGFFAYSSWGLYGASKPDLFLFTSQFPGAILMLIILIQFIIYRKNRK